ncbi:MAG: aminopeptidase P family protein [Alphaproteobacteria bacterium]|nr:aminopeptidase P family protein [Alphaproteobacteria bacterium]
MPPSISFERLKNLRTEMQQSHVNGFIIPHSDEHQGEYIPAYAERLKWLTGFNGSAGLAIVTTNKAALFVDGRYTLQAQNQVDATLIDIQPLAEILPSSWLREELKKGDRVAYDPWLHTENEIEQYQSVCVSVGAQLVACEDNFINKIWKDQPEYPKTLLSIHEFKYAGKITADKIMGLVHQLNQERIDVVVLTMLDSIAWLLNIRANDLPCTPVAISFALVHKDATIDFFINSDEITPTSRSHLGNKVRIHPLKEFESVLRQNARQNYRILIDPKTAPYKISQIITAERGQVVLGNDPCILPKACKNAIEIAGMKAAHIRDGAALCNFLSWLYSMVPRQTVTEIDAVKMLYQMRSQQSLFKDVSFETISASGSNGAVVHYRVCPESNRIIDPSSLYLLDSGGQYLDGTTDVTRTIAFQTPNPEQKDRFTRVLKGHIAIAQVCFPKGTSGSQIDILARHSLWQIGVDYEHGTGHGVGSYLNVHEGPQSINKRGNSVGLQPGMILSNEPGYYKPGAYGIRIENLVVVIEKNDIPTAEHPMLGFDTLTVVPICLNLVDITLLDSTEIKWLNQYHSYVRKVLTPLVCQETAAWIIEQTQEIQVI